MSCRAEAHARAVLAYALTSPHPPPLTRPDLIIVIVALSIIYFVTVVITEMAVLYTEDSRRKQLAAQAARNKNKEDGASKRLSARSVASSIRGKDAVVGPTSNELNPLFSSLAVAGSPDALRSRETAIAAVMSTAGAPTESVWSVFKQSYASLNADYLTIMADYAELKRASQQGIEEGGGDTARQPKASKRSFAPQRTATEGLPPGSFKGNPLMR